MDLKKIEYLEETKDLIKQALIEKGAEVRDDDTFRSYADKIGELKTAGESKIGKLVSGQEVSLTADDLGEITIIEKYAFYYRSNLVSIEIPNTVTKIQQYAFAECSKLKEIEIPEGVQYIYQNAFKYSKIKKLVLPSSITFLESNAFYGSSSLKQVVFQGQAPSWNSAFSGCNYINLYDLRNCTSVPDLSSTTYFNHASGCKIVIPDNLYDTWTTTLFWNKLTDVVWVKASEYVEG